MFRTVHFLLSTFLAIGLIQSSLAQNGCTNTAQYPGVAITPDPGGMLTEVSTCIFFQEFTQFTGITSGSTYKFTINGNGFITIRSGGSGGPVVASGYDYVIYTATAADDLFAHYNVNDQCLTATNCQVSTVQ